MLLTQIFGVLPWRLCCVVKWSQQAVDLVNPRNTRGWWRCAQTIKSKSPLQFLFILFEINFITGANYQGLIVCYCRRSQYLCVPEQSDAETDHDVVERVEAHHAHQQILQDNLRRGPNSYIIQYSSIVYIYCTCWLIMPCWCDGFNFIKLSFWKQQVPF